MIRREAERELADNSIDERGDRGDYESGRWVERSLRIERTDEISRICGNVRGRIARTFLLG